MKKKTGYYKLRIICFCKASFFNLRRRISRKEELKQNYLSKELWYKGMTDEIKWWTEWLSTNEGLTWKQNIENPDYAIHDYLITDRIKEIANESVSILDIGSGPVTHIGYTYPGKKIKITAIDPLAKQYAQVLKKAKINPVVKTISGNGEILMDNFEPDTFDFVYASNSLDHSYNPVIVIKNMISVSKKSGYVILRHYKNEAVSAEYDGFHQWNFNIKKNELIIWNNKIEYNISQLFENEAIIKSYLEPSSSFGMFNHNDWVVCIFKKI